MKLKRRQNKNSGFVLCMTIIIMVLLLVYALAVSSMAIRVSNFSKKQKLVMAAQFAGESGVYRGIEEIKKNSSWDGTTDGSGDDSKLTFRDVSMPNSISTYTVWVFNNLSGSGDITASNGTVVPSGSCYILGEGKSNLNSVKYVSIMLSSQSIYEDGIFAEEKVQVSGNVDISAYDSSTGLAAPGEADIATNNTLQSSIELHGSAITIDGSLVAGPGADLGADGSITISGHPTITGDPIREALPTERDLDPVTLPTGLPQMSISGTNLSPGDYSNAGTLTIRRNDIILTGSPGGSEYIFDGINATSRGKLQIDSTNGPVKIYLTANAFFSANSGIEILNDGPAGMPLTGDVQILATSDVDEIKIRGRAELSCAIYAPDSTFDMAGNSDFFGAIVVDTARIIGHSDFKYDLSLRTWPGGGAVAVKSWQYF
ncbi:MAG: hypothetical protein K8T10_20250 [Candidatus Eremiobacteraeota bacterium]|nr:hypothetical protein [Candidatus Eremiobacteraeota bacterium]